MNVAIGRELTNASPFVNSSSPPDIEVIGGKRRSCHGTVADLPKLRRI
jgi:hypothetical protein